MEMLEINPSVFSARLNAGKFISGDSQVADFSTSIFAQVIRVPAKHGHKIRRVSKLVKVAKQPVVLHHRGELPRGSELVPGCANQ